MAFSLPMHWRLLTENTAWAHQTAAGIAVDNLLLQSVGAGWAPPTLRVWNGPPGLVIGWGEGRLAHLAAGAAFLAQWGLPLLRRYTGGQAVLQGPEHLNFTACLPQDPKYNLTHDYIRLLEPFMYGLQRSGLPVTFAEVPGAYCIGRHDLAVGGRKLAGTAQARRLGAVLVHGTLLVDPDPAAVAGLITGFYAALGVKRTVNPQTLTTFNTAAGGPAAAAAQLLLAGWHRRARITPAPLSGREAQSLEACTAGLLYPWTNPAPAPPRGSGSGAMGGGGATAGFVGRSG